MFEVRDAVLLQSELENAADFVTLFREDEQRSIQKAEQKVGAQGLMSGSCEDEDGPVDTRE